MVEVTIRFQSHCEQIGVESMFSLEIKGGKGIQFVCKSKVAIENSNQY